MIHYHMKVFAEETLRMNLWDEIDNTWKNMFPKSYTLRINSWDEMGNAWKNISFKNDPSRALPK